MSTSTFWKFRVSQETTKLLREIRILVNKLKETSCFVKENAAVKSCEVIWSQCIQSTLRCVYMNKIHSYIVVFLLPVTCSRVYSWEYEMSRGLYPSLFWILITSLSLAIFKISLNHLIYFNRNHKKFNLICFPSISANNKFEVPVMVVNVSLQMRFLYVGSVNSF